MLKFISTKTLIALVLGVSFLTFCSSALTDDSEKQRKQMSLVFQAMMQQHFNPPTIDDAFSKKVFTQYFKQLDYSKRFLTQEDSIALLTFSDQLDNELQNNTEFKFFESINAAYERKLQLVNSYYKDFLAAPLDFSVNEEIQLDAEKRSFPKDDAELKEQWRKYLKYMVLANIQTKLDIQEKAAEKKDTSVKIKTFEVLEKEARAKVQKDHEDMFKRLQRETKSERFAEYVNAVVHVFDPHSDFFPPKEKENFDIQMSGKLEGIGATLQEKDGYIKVMSIVPGSPSYKQGELKPEDFILKVGQGDEEPVDIVEMRLDNAVKLIRGKKGTTVKLTIKKPDGTIKVISIVRDVVVMEESYAKSVIVEDEKNKQRIGYINLPSFYADFNDRNGRTCSADIRKELVKLNAEKVDGIVLDLRNNGGGSLQDVVTMGGYFITEGPIVQVKGREATPYVFNDENPDIVYDGPLVILVNQFSASASEILAAAMQDYKRAVIIGSTASYGKGTVQRFYDLSSSEEAGASAKITTQKFYRINGGSTQLKGVIPDIVLPDIYQNLKIGEKEMEYAIPWDQITPGKYKEWSKKPNIKAIQEKSKARVENNEEFKHIASNAQYMKVKQNNTNYSLNLKTYQSNLNSQKKEEESFKKEAKEIDGWKFATLKEDAVQADTAKTNRNKEYYKTLKKDVYLYEAVQVIKDIRK